MVVEINDVSSVAKGDCLVDFYTPTCGPCRALGPVLDEISNEFSGLRVAKIDVAKNPDASMKFGVMSVPTIMYLKDMKVVEITHGFMGKDHLKSFVVKHFKNGKKNN